MNLDITTVTGSRGAILLISCLLLALTGCQSLRYAGTADYSVTPVFDKQNNMHCCAVHIHNGKEIASLKAHLKKTADGGYDISLDEQGVAAFEGQRIAAMATQDAIDKAAKAAAVAALAPLLPALAPVAGAALASPGIGAAAAGAAAVVGAQKLSGKNNPKNSSQSQP